MPERLMPRPPAPFPPPSPSRSRSPRSGTVLAIDYGDKRLGVAVGEEELGTAHPVTVLHGQGAAREAALAALIAEWRPVRLVVGMPTRADGEHPLARRIEAFIRRLEARHGLPVTRVGEDYSSAGAETRLREAAGARRAARATRERELDAYAAQLLLEQYFAEAGR